jgi:integrase
VLEIRRIWHATLKLPDKVGPQIGRIIRLLLVTGQRRSEVVASEQWTLPKERTKNKLEHEVPLTRMALKELRAAMDECDWSTLSFKLDYEHRKR